MLFRITANLYGSKESSLSDISIIIITNSMLMHLKYKKLSAKVIKHTGTLIRFCPIS